MSRHPQSTPLPDSLKQQLASFRGHLWKVKVAEAVLAGLFGLLFSYLLVFGLDRIWATPGLIRLAILLGGTSLFALFAPYWIHRWVFGHRRDDQLARLIADRFPKLGDRLLGVVELQDQVESEESLSPELRDAAMRRVARDAEKRQLDDALPAARHRSWSLAVLASLVVAAVALVLVPKAGLNALKRWLMPLGDTPRYTFTKLQAYEKTWIVPYDEPFPLTLRLAEDSDERVESGTAQLGRQAPVTATLSDGAYTFKFPAQQAEGVVAIRIGDSTHRIRITPTLRPAIEAVAAVVHYPDYLRLQPKRIDLRAGAFSTLEGSEVSLEATVSRNVQRAQLSVRALPRPVDPLDYELGAPFEPEDKPEEPAEPTVQPLHIDGTSIASDPVRVGEVPMELTLNWVDTLNLEDEGGYRLRVDSVKDQQPTAYIQGIERQRVMLEKSTVEFEVLCEDDFGVKAMGLEWNGEFTKPTDESPAKGERLLEKGAPDLRRLSASVAFSPSTEGIKPQKLTMRAFVEDYNPERGRIYSEPILLLILTPDAHAQLLKEDFDRIIGELEDAARREQNNFDENRRLERLDDEDLQEDEGRERLNQQENKEGENTDRMKELTERMESLFKDAMRNGEIDKETMKSMAEAMQKMRELSDQDMPKVEKKLEDSQDQRSTPEQAKKDLQEAIEEQKKVLEKMKETIEQANEANRNFEASTFVNRLKRAASELNGIAVALIDRVDADAGDSTIAGTTIEDLDPADQRLLGELTMQHRRTASDVRWIQEDLGHFYARTQKEIHKDLLTEMQESQIDTALDDNRERIASNKTWLAISHSKKWAEQLLEWAKKLEGPQDGTGGGAGGPGGNPNSLDDDDFEFMLKVMQMIQAEQDIRARTRALEQLRRSLSAEENQKAAPANDARNSGRRRPQSPPSGILPIPTLPQ